MSDFVIGALVLLLGLLGLLAAANALDQGMAIFGTALFLFAVFFEFWLVKKAFDRKSGS
jgi:ABC-type uncharacterized transport system permease subunit